jgi:hypothetical protein
MCVKIAITYMFKQPTMALVGILDRREAIAVLKEITSRCAGALRLTVSVINLVPPRADDTISKGYQIHIKSEICSEDRSLLQSIMDARQLALKEIGDRLIIFKPKK